MSQRHVLGPATLGEFHRALDDLVRVCVDFKLASPHASSRRPGHGNTVPFTSPTGWQTDQAPARAEAGWVARLVRHLPWAAAAK